MMMKNSFGIEPGTWRNVAKGDIVVVTEIQTHHFVGGDLIELPEPEVLYRDLIINVEKHVTYGMNLTEFKLKFARA